MPLAPLILNALAFLIAVSSAARAQETDVDEKWYRTEVLIFLRDDEGSLGAERWDPLPEVRYPARVRHLVDPTLASRRLQASAGFRSRLDEHGVQHLLVPAAEALLDTAPRPDSILPKPEPELLPELLPGSGAGLAEPSDPTEPSDDEGPIESSTANDAQLSDAELTPPLPFFILDESVH